MEEHRAKYAVKILKLVLLPLTIISGAVIFFIFNPGKAVKLIFPDLSSISYVNSVITRDTVFTTLSLILQNKNPYRLTIDTLHFEAALNDTCIARQTVPLNISQSRFDKDTVKLQLNLNAKHIKKLIRHLQSKDSTNAGVRGFVVYETVFGRKKLNFEKNIRIEVPVPPEIKVLKVERKSFSYRDKILKAVAKIRIRNNGKRISLQLANVKYDLTVHNTLHSSGSIPHSVDIVPGSSIVVDVPMEIEVFHPLKTAWLIRTDQDRLSYSLRITCDVREKVSDKSFASTAEIEASGMLELVK